MILGRTLARAFVVDVARLFAARLGGTFRVALVEQINDFGILEGQVLLSRIADGELIVLISGKNGEMRVVAEGQIAVMHDGAKIVVDSSGIGFLLDFEVDLHAGTRRRVLRQYFQVIVAIEARLFVMQTDGMPEFVS